MNRRLQWRITGETALFFLVLFAVGAGLIAQTLVCPVIDRPGENIYCCCVKETFAAAEESIDLLLSNAQLDEVPLWDELLAAASRGVRVRVLLDESEWSTSITEKNRPTIEFLKVHGIEARFDDPAVTIHAKLVIVDRRVVILGSSNWNHYAFTDQEQANVKVQDEQVGEVFATYFDRLWRGNLPPGGIRLDLGLLTGEGPLLIPIPETVGTANYASLLLELLHRVKRSIHVVMYRISYYPQYSGSLSNEILGALVDAAARGLDVKVLIDDCAFYPGSAEENLEAALYLHLHGVKIRLDDPSETTHCKLVIIDAETVLVGSTNWNYYALEKNNEVDLALIGLPLVAAPYEQFFHVLWEEGRRLDE